MEGGDNILDTILEEENLDYVDQHVDADDDVEMLDVEEGELVEEHGSPQNVSGEVGDAGGDVDEVEKKSNEKNRRRRANKKKNKRKRNGLGSEGFDINRFVLNACRRLKEKKSYMVYTAVGCLGVSALSDLIKEVDAIQTCGGQKTADGRRFRTGGGILWSIIKVREPQAFKEIMKKAKEFEKQFRQPNVKQPSIQKKEEESSQGVPFKFVGGNQGNVSDNTPSAPQQMQDQHEPSRSREKNVAVYDRLRIPVSYDDDLLGSSVDNDAA